VDSPLHEYVMHEFKDWLARLYARPGMEVLLDHTYTQSSGTATMSDIWDAPIIKEFCGLDGKPFFGGKGTEGHLIFSINMDGFNPYGNKQSGKQVSVSAIYMTCLNLPCDTQNHMENMFLVGVVPGPKE
ncbi:hypothetical protein P691DRAFT_652611, partial [Macrolepiota fuliginosa MF-IS2]